MVRDASRRRLMAGIGAAGAASVAGCSGLPLLGEDGDGANYAEWMRSEPGGEARRLDFSVVEPASLEEHRSEIPDAFSVDGQPHVPPDRESGEVGFGVDYGEIEAVVGVGNLHENRLGSHVISGPYEQAALEEYLSSAGYEHHSTYAGFDVWGRYVPDVYPSEGDQGRFTLDQLQKGQAVAFDGDLLVTGIVSGFNRITMVEATVDAIRNEADRYAEVNDPGAELLDRLGGGQVRAGWTDEELTAEWAADVRGGFEGQVGRGIQFDVRGETTELRLVRVFADTDDVDLDAIEEWVASLPEIEVSEDEETVRPYEEYDASTERQGRSVVVTGTMPTADLTTGHWP